MRVHVMELKAGDIVSNDIFNSYGLHVLSAGTILKEHDISRLFQHQLDYIDIAEPSGDSAAQAPYYPSSMKLNPLFQSAVSGFEQLFSQAIREGRLRDEDVNESFRPLISNFREEHDVVSLLLVLGTKDEYTYQHSVQVGMLSYYIALWTGRSEEEAHHIGKAGYLHDIGKCRIESGILNKPGELSEEEFREIKQHPIHGFDIIQQSFQDELLAKAVLQHHERLDGSGYPYGIRAPHIHTAARIVAVADTYSAMISTRVYREKRDLLHVLKELYEQSFSKLDPMITHTFIRQMLPNFIGKRATLSNGSSGTIVMTNPSDFFRPLVRIDNDFVDLARHSDVEIVEIAV
jgi:putative nucleotidyltransferase with HDIG domain